MKAHIKRKTAIDIAFYILLIVLSLVFIFPYLFMVNKSLSSELLVKRTLVPFFPWGWDQDGLVWCRPTFAAYRNIFAGKYNYLKNTWNTLKIVLFNMVAVPLSASVVAYGFAKLEFFGKKFLFALMISTLLLPSMVLQIPQYILFTSIGWGQSAKPLTWPNLLGGGAMNIFLVRQFMRSIPKDLDEAAKIDGAGPFMRYALITMPLCVPILIYLLVGTFNGYWSDFFGPLIYLNVKDEYTLAIAIFRDFNSNYKMTEVPNGMAAGVFMSVFPAILFFLFQRRLIDGVMITGMKG